MRRVALAIALLVLAAGCGEDGGGDDSKDRVAALVARAQKASKAGESYRAALTGDSRLEGNEFEMRMTGVSSADQTRGRFKGRMSLEGSPMQGMEFILDEGREFVRGEILGGELPDGKEWVEVDTGPNVASLSPSEFVEFISKADDVEDVGSEVIRGEPAIHLRGPLDIKKLGEATGPKAEQLTAGLPDDVDFDIEVWIRESDARLTRMKLEMSSEDQGSLEFTADVLGYDVPLDRATAPEPATVYVP
jgi:hypothetical protein